MKIKKRSNRQEPSHRMTISFSQATYETFRIQSAKLGYSVAEIARRVVAQGVAAGLLTSRKPNPVIASIIQSQEHHRRFEKLRLVQEQEEKILQARIAIQDQEIAMRQREIEDCEETIIRQAIKIQYYNEMLSPT